MKLRRKTKSIIAYSLSLFLFLLAGLFQAIDSLLPEFYHVLLALMAHTIFLSLNVAWGISLIHRMVRKDLRFFFVFIASLIVFFFVIRMVKYGITEGGETLNRYLWYSYYVPECLVPPFILLSALSLERKQDKSLSKRWYCLLLPAIALIGLIYTNGLHEWAFSLSFEDGKLSYRHGPVFYIALAWEIAVTLLGLVVMFRKSQVSASKKKIWIPLVTFFACVLLSSVCFLLNTSSFKIPELLCFTCIALIESSIVIGLIPSNAHYREYFHASKYRSFIMDDNFETVYSSKDVFDIKKEELSKAITMPLMVSDDLRLSSERISGGYVYWVEDLSHLHKVNAALLETNNELLEENNLLLAENELKEKKAKIEEQTRLYSKVDLSIKETRENALKAIANIQNNPQIPYKEKMGELLVLGTYLKRRSNFVLLSEKSAWLDIEEFSFVIKESLHSLSFLGVSSSYECSFDETIRSETLTLFYDFFEETVELAFERSKAIHVFLSKEKNEIRMRLEIKAKEFDSSSFEKELKRRFKNAPMELALSNERDVLNCTFSLKEKGGRL